MAEAQSTKLKFIRFNPAIDIHMLREVVALNPYNDARKWQKVAENLNATVSKIRPDAKKFTERSMRDRITVLLQTFIKQDMESLKK